MRLLKQFLRNFILRSDMFAAQPTLRFGGQPSYETIFGGCLSILLVIGFAVIFGRSFINVLTKVNVSAITTIQDNPYDSSQINDIRFAVGIQGLDFNQSQRYFNIILKLKSLPIGGAPTYNEIQLYPCQKQDWVDLGQNFDKLFQVYSMGKMLCPSPSQNLSIKGFAGSQQWVSMSLFVEQCRNLPGANWTCHTPATIQNKINTQLTINDFFKVNLLMVNSIISPDNQDPIKKVLQNQIFITFSNTSGSRCQVKLGRYEIVTDNSIWPVSSQSTIEGHYMTSHESYTINLYSTHYVRVQIQKSRNIYSVTRSHDKLDEMLSYVGGLFSLLFGWLFFFIASYNEYKYEIAIGEQTFAMDSTGRKIRQQHFGFLTYLRYAIYDWLKAFNIPISWPNMEEIDAARQQANEQMDVRYLMKRLQHIQKINKILLGQHNFICSNLTRPPSLEQAKRLRKITQYYDKVIKMENQQSLILNIFRLSNQSSLLNKNQIFNSILLDTNKEQIKSVQNNLWKENKCEQQKQEQKQQQQSQLDQEDQEIQANILQIYKENCQKNILNQDQLSNKILNQIPQSIRERFMKLQRKQKMRGLSKKQKETKLKIQSTFQLQQGTPNFLAMLARKQST